MSWTCQSAEIEKHKSRAEVTVSGWVHSSRNMGGVLFVDLRDASGICQIVCSPDLLSEELKHEYVIRVTGQVRRRPLGQENLKLDSGEFELEAAEIEILNRCPTLPFQVNNDAIGVSEALRQEYRYLDLRRSRNIEMLKTRSEMVFAMRKHLRKAGFIDVETPMLIKTTPEGARDFLVPSRTNPGEFYALPQSPQLFKQILMISGLGKYFQVARCFRDEAFRSDRQPEFTQLDIETSFSSQEELFREVEKMLFKTCKKVEGLPLLPVEECYECSRAWSGAPEFNRMTYEEAMSSYGTDKPDTRFEYKIKDISDMQKCSLFKVFQDVLDDDGTIQLLVAPLLKKRDCQELEHVAKKNGAKGLIWVRVEQSGKGEDKIEGPCLKHLGLEGTGGSMTPEENMGSLFNIYRQTGQWGLPRYPRGTLLMVAGPKEEALKALGAVRLALPKYADIEMSRDAFKFVWVTDFPWFEKKDGMLTPKHHPFTAPNMDDLNDKSLSIEKTRSQAYDLVLNGVEIGGGSVRIHDPEMQKNVFNILGISEKEAEEKFGFFLKALQFGAPPHLGMALGIDRLLAVLTGHESIRDVIPFPKTQTGRDLMIGAPSPAAAEQLEELDITCGRKKDSEDGETIKVTSSGQSGGLTVGQLNIKKG